MCLYRVWFLLCALVFCFCFFKQKTAYEMRISDWSSDVCSSDLLTWSRFHDPAEPMHAFGAFEKTGVLVGITHAIFHRSCWLAESTCYLQEPLCRCADRKSVV